HHRRCGDFSGGPDHGLKERFPAWCDPPSAVLCPVLWHLRRYGRQRAHVCSPGAERAGAWHRPVPGARRSDLVRCCHRARPGSVLAGLGQAVADLCRRCCRSAAHSRAGFIPAIPGVSSLSVSVRSRLGVSRYYGLLFFLGALIGPGLGRRNPNLAEEFTLPVASGVVAGGSLMGVVLVFWANGGSILNKLLGG